ncbi:MULTISPECIES: aminoacyltransferase [unclassified Enterococcus]|uniref:aminoacyltransferase n=1 Tax=unclassified Enterococcus TaxID=2608891 RepID=UPI0015575444|nr:MULTISPECIES: aminoacyltransferase [unclassified Enterococcus]MBS7576870.1 aminoacyltransferase [Enterococcus sp. MMGLQ5-2]MBS7584277.1 aminoacyltransferase [Enterococcus sp. MMGLQ5-1]NPD12133.1 aminoacyltransferase [Enterococcus sp. MMGLQ5-1]NPD36705.1 aminoacyltransferase [Enterococcus sp. MMGLQ5-2]
MKFVENISPQAHDEFVKKSPLNHLLQSSTWAKVKDNWGSAIVGVKNEHDELVASALVLIKHLPLGLTMIYTPKGPILDYTNQELVNFFFVSFKKWAKKQNALFIKFDPAVIYRSGKVGGESVANPAASEIIENIKSVGAEHLGFNLKMSETIQPRFQANEPLSALVNQIYPKHTNRIMKDAKKRGVTGRRATIDALKAFSAVVNKTETRKGVSLRNFDYFQQLMTLYGEDAYLHIAEINLFEKYHELKNQLETIETDIANTPENQKKRFNRLNDQKRSVEKYLAELSQHDCSQNVPTVIAGILSIKFGGTLEMLYAGMDDDFKKFYPQYLLYPIAFNEGFEDGCLWGNMGGVEGTLDDGLSKFKSNFNPDIQELIGEFNLPVNRLLYKLSNFAYKLRKRRNAHD